MSANLMRGLAMKFRDEADSPHGHVAVSEAGCAHSLLMISAKKHAFSSRGTTVKNACDTMAMMAEDSVTRETFLEAHASQPVLPELLEDFENEPEVKKSIINLLEKIITGEPSPWLEQVLQDAAWRNKALEILMGQSKAAQNDGGRLRMLLNTLQVMAGLAGGDLQGTPEGLVSDPRDRS